MNYPKIIVLFIGGTHGEFLKNCYNIFNNKKIRPISSTGHSPISSQFKEENMSLFYNGKSGKHTLNQFDNFEVVHCWYNEYLEYTSKFYYIDYPDHLASTLIDLFMYKTKKDNNTIIKYLRNNLPENIGKKINELNWKDIFIKSINRCKSKYLLQKSIKRIDIFDIYNLEKLKKIYKDMGIYNNKYEEKFTKYYNKWLIKNDYFIENLTTEQNKY